MAINLGEYDPDAKLAKINLGKFAPLPEDMEYEQFRTRWLKNQQRGIGEATWEWAKAVPEGFSEYFTEDVWNALNNKSMLRSMFGFGEEEGDAEKAWSSLAQASEIGLRDSYNTAKVITSNIKDYFNSELTQEQQVERDFSRFKYEQNYFNDAREKMMETVAPEFRDDMSVLADFLDPTNLAPSLIGTKFLNKGTRKVVKGGLGYGGQVAGKVIEGVGKATEKAFGLPAIGADKLKLKGMYRGLQGAAFMVGAGGGGIFSTVGTVVAGIGIGEALGKVAAKTGRQMAEVSRVFSQPSSHARFLHRITTDDKVSKPLRTLAARLYKMRGTKMYDVGFDMLVAGIGAGSAQIAMEAAKGKAAEEIGYATGAGVAMGSPTGAIAGERGSGKSTEAFDAQGNLSDRSFQSIENYLVRKAEMMDKETLRAFTKIDDSSKLTLATLDELSGLGTMRMHLVSDDLFRSKMGQKAGASLPAAYNPDEKTIYLNESQLKEGTNVAASLFLHEYGHHFLYDMIGASPLMSRKILESFEDPDGYEYFFRDADGKNLGSIKVNEEAHTFAQQYAKAIDSSIGDVAAELNEDRNAYLLAQEIGAEQFSMMMQDSPNAFEKHDKSFRHMLLGAAHDALAKMGVIDPRNGAEAKSVISEAMLKNKDVRKTYDNFIKERTKHHRGRADDIETGRKHSPNSGQTSDERFTQLFGGVGVNLQVAAQFHIRDSVMYNELMEALALVEESEGDYAGLGKGVEGSQLHPKIREIFGKSGQYNAAVKAIIDMIQAHIDQRKMMKFGYRSASLKNRSDYNPFFERSVTPYAWQISPKKVRNWKGRTVYPNLKVMGYDADLIMSNAERLAQANFIEDIDAFLEAFQQRASEVLSPDGEGRINPQGLGENEIMVAALGMKESFESIQNPKLAEWLTNPENKLRNAFKSYDVGQLAGLSTQNKAGFAFDYKNAKHNYMPALAGQGYQNSTIKPKRGDRVAELVKRANRLRTGAMSEGEYQKAVNKFKPVETLTKSDIIPATRDEMIKAIKGDSRKKLVGAKVPKGTNVGIRLDINAYLYEDTWVPTIHEAGKSGREVGKVLSYDSVAVVDNATLDNKKNISLKIAAGDVPKTSYARINGKWNPKSKKAAVALAKEALANKDGSWTQVGFDPERHSYFYDRKDNSLAVTSADQVVQVGRAVFAKNANKQPAMKAFGKGNFFMPAQFESPQFQEFITAKGKPAYAKKNKKGDYIPQKFYHRGYLGTTTPKYMAGEIDSAWTPNLDNSNVGAFYISPSKGFAKNFINETTKERNPPPIELATNISKVWSYRNPNHVSLIMDAVNKEVFTRITYANPDDHPKTIESRRKKREENKKEVQLGDWRMIESAMGVIKDAGFDAFEIKEDGVYNLGVFDPQDVKLIKDENVVDGMFRFNRVGEVAGSFDPKNPDIRFMPSIKDWPVMAWDGKKRVRIPAEQALKRRDISAIRTGEGLNDYTWKDINGNVTPLEKVFSKEAAEKLNKLFSQPINEKAFTEQKMERLGEALQIIAEVPRTQKTGVTFSQNLAEITGLNSDGKLGVEKTDIGKNSDIEIFAIYSLASDGRSYDELTNQDMIQEIVVEVDHYHHKVKVYAEDAKNFNDGAVTTPSFGLMAYQSIFDYAHNNQYEYKPDTILSKRNSYRLVPAMLSSILKNKSYDHLRVSSWMRLGDTDTDRKMQKAFNQRKLTLTQAIAMLAMHERNNVAEAPFGKGGPLDPSDWYFDLEDGAIASRETSDGLGDGGILQSIKDYDKRFTYAMGVSSVKRAILTETLLDRDIDLPLSEQKPTEEAFNSGALDKIFFMPAEFEAAVGVAPKRVSVVPSLDAGTTIAKEPEFQDFVQNNKKITDAFGFELLDERPVIGGWKDSQTNQISREASHRLLIKSNSDADLNTFAAITGVLADEVQDSVMKVRYIKRNTKESKGREYHIKIDPVLGEQITSLQFLERYGLEGGFTYDPKDEKLIFATWSPEGWSQVGDLVAAVTELGGFQGLDEASASVGFPEIKDYRSLLSPARIKRYYGGTNRAAIRDLAEQARTKLEEHDRAGTLFMPATATQRAATKKSEMVFPTTTYVNALPKGESLSQKSEDWDEAGWNKYFEDQKLADALMEQLASNPTAQGWQDINEVRTGRISKAEFPSAPTQVLEWLNDPAKLAAFIEAARQKNPKLVQLAEQGVLAAKKNYGAKKTPEVVAQSFIWGFLSRMLDPYNQEAGWLRCTASNDFWNAIYQSIDGNFTMDRGEYMTAEKMAIKNRGWEQQTGYKKLLDRKKELGEERDAAKKLVKTKRQKDAVTARYKKKIDDINAKIKSYTEDRYKKLNKKAKEAHQREANDMNLNQQKGTWIDMVSNMFDGQDAANANKAGQNARQNINGAYSLLQKWNGRWNEVTDIFNSSMTGQQMREQMWKMGLEGGGIGDKVTSFVIATMADGGVVIMDRWQFVNCWINEIRESVANRGQKVQDILNDKEASATAKKLAKQQAKEYEKYGNNPFRYSANDVPEDRSNFYDAVGSKLTPVAEHALYRTMEFYFQQMADSLQQLDPQAYGWIDSPFAVHWLLWNIAKDEAVGHSSLDILSDIIQNNTAPQNPSQRQAFVQNYQNQPSFAEKNEYLPKENIQRRSRFTINQGVPREEIQETRRFPAFGRETAAKNTYFR